MDGAGRERRKRAARGNDAVRPLGGAPPPAYLGSNCSAAELMQ
ncbi:hypothetical protein LMG24076_01296 [Trinickia soli]|nr:hypothetical protein LMG24076_01296 [Trinickia soli]